MNKALLTREDKGGRGQEIVIDSITHLGRSDRIMDYKARDTPKSLFDAKLAIYIDPAKIPSRISRNHLLIYTPDSIHNCFSVLDLNSKNGTDVNGIPVPCDARIPLKEGALISLAGEALFRYELLKNDKPNRGIMVGHYGGNLRGTKNDVLKLKEEFERRDFGIEELINGSATKENVLEKLDALKRQVTEDSIFLFYFSGHGDEKGNLVLSDWHNCNLSPAELFDALEDYRGQKLVILDGCYTSATANQGLPPRTILIGTEGNAYEGKIETMIIPGTSPAPGEPPIMSYTSRALYNALKDHPQRIDIGGLVRRIKQDPRVKVRQEIGFHGMTQINLHTRRDN